VFGYYGIEEELLITNEGRRMHDVFTLNARIIRTKKVSLTPIRHRACPVNFIKLKKVIDVFPAQRVPPQFPLKHL
jgi:hypothetical protein